MFIMLYLIVQDIVTEIKITDNLEPKDIDKAYNMTIDLKI